MTWTEIGQQVQKARKQKEWSTQKLAHIAGLPKREIASLERGHGYNISAGRFVAILSLLGLQVTLGA